MSYRPNRPVGTSPEAVAMQAMWDLLWGDQSIFVPTTALSFSKNSKGKYIPVLSGPRGGVATSVTAQYKITTILPGNQDYFMAKAWDGVTLGALEVPIAKNEWHRPLITNRTILGTTYTYVYTDDNHRTAADGVNPVQNEELDRPFEVDAGLTSGLVTAVLLANNTGVVDGSGNPIRLLDQTPRVWAQYA